MSNDANTALPQSQSEQDNRGSPEGWDKLGLERKQLCSGFKDATLLEWEVPALSVIVEYLSLSHLESKIPRKYQWLKNNFMDVYALAWAVILTAMLLIWASPTGKSWLKWVVGLFAAIRAFDILKYRVYFLLVKGHQDTSKNSSNIPRRFVFALLNFYEIVVAYAILYLVSGHITRGTVPLDSSVAAFYYSLVTMVTLGYGDYAPDHNCARAIVVLQLVTSLVFLLFIIPALISLFTGSQGEASQKAALDSTRSKDSEGPGVGHS